MSTVSAAHELLGGTLTLGFTDVEGSTELLGRIGANRYREVLEEHRKVVERAVAEAGGRVVDSRGEEFFVVFARARDAVAAAVAIEREHAAEAWPEQGEVRVRVGLHTGEPLVHEGGYLGLDVHRAARICATGHGGQVLLSQTTWALIEDALPQGVAAKDLGEHALKGLERPVRIFQLVIDGLESQFPPLRLVDAAAGDFGGEEDLAQAVNAAAEAPPRHRLRLPHRHRSKERQAELAWLVRNRVATAPPGLRQPLAELAAALFDATRSAADADRFLAAVDRRRLERRVREYRELSVVSRKAQQESERLAGQLEALNGLEESRRELESVTAAAASADRPTAEVARGVHAARLRLDERLERARTGIDLGSQKLHRTRHHGIYRRGQMFVVPAADEVGIEQFHSFGTLAEAREYRRGLKLAGRPAKDFGGGAPHDYYVHGYTPKTKDDGR